ncbi:TetR/AcrR family transcriptional regulator [Luteipulveratus mongoliensis]|uniref:HTH tetR-type domain-containing protein n=1 Tax=Luteipulveratus mongoliensis TaxID=571913 RepID=A0A0K1JIB6_9MICO|nr:TetR/AcrR family transcriptional regulator [Luteipulveratus mongoliensis]AKU16323.1 hypothetical protein VV02_11380 [Luteipulveratus mongoliensis]
MARTADHGARRQQIRDAIRVVALESGLPAVTVARVAAAAGMSVGLVQHYFPSKEAMLVDAFTEVRREVIERIDVVRVRAEKRYQRIEQILVAALSEMLPLDARRRSEVYLVLAFAGMALHHEGMRRAERDNDRELRRRISEAVTNGKECGEVATETDAEQTAWTMLAAVQGLTWHLYDDDTSAARKRTRGSVEQMVHAVFVGPCARADEARAARSDA